MKYFLVTVVVFLLGACLFGLIYANRSYPRTYMLGINLGNKKASEMEKILTEKFSGLKKIEIIWGTSKWEIDPKQIDLEYNVPASVARVMGTRGWTSVEPVFSIDENKINELVTEISGQVNIPTREPDVTLQDGMVMVGKGENGQEVDERDLMTKIRKSIAWADNLPIQLLVKILNPRLSDTQASDLKMRGERLLNKKMVIKKDSSSWEISPEQTLAWIDPFTANGWKKSLIETWVEELAVTFDQPAQNALFRFVDTAKKVEEFKPAKTGQKIKQDELINSMIDNLTNLEKGDNKEIDLEIPIEKTEPTITNSQVNTLGIKEIVGKGESDYSGSIVNRIYNMKKAAEDMNGVLVAPGEIFSFNKYVGDISAAGGYKQAYVIKEGKTILGDGGGVCQVSTTLFRAALAAGLPIEERTAHAYRVHYYENDSQPGIDATIFTPSVDLKFRNDTSAYILIQSRVDETKNKLYFDLYGTSDGRKVEMSKVRLWDSTPPPPDLYQDDPSIPSGQVRQVDWAAWGVKTAFDWKVTRGNEVLQQRTFYSNFRPWQAIYLRGTK